MAKPKLSGPVELPLPGKLLHRFHPAHALKLVPDDNGGAEFRCDGCKLAGTGARYECAACNFDLHPSCALAPAERQIGGFPFALLLEPGPGGGSRVCDACGGAARGFVYRCAELDHDVHPCCAADLLPERFALAGGLSVELRMDEPPPRRCVLCAADERKEKKKRGPRGLWSYRCDIGDGGGAVLLHVACARGLASPETSGRASMDDMVRVMAYAFEQPESVAGDFKPYDASRSIIVRSPRWSSPAGDSCRPGRYCQ